MDGENEMTGLRTYSEKFTKRPAAITKTYDNSHWRQFVMEICPINFLFGDFKS